MDINCGFSNMLNDSASLIGYRVLLTGGSSGIGQSIAYALMKAGAEVTVISRRLPEGWENSRLLGFSQQLTYISADLRDTDDTQKKIDSWLKQIDGKIDVLIHSAIIYGSSSRRPLGKINLLEWDEVFAVNIRAQFVITQAVLPFLERRSAGLIVGISSDIVFDFGPGRIDYSASKAASFNFLRSLAEELKESNIRVVNLLPETQVDTPGIRKRRPPNFNYSAYASPDSFNNPMVEIVSQMGVGMNGQCFLVTAEGSLVLLQEKNLQSLRV